MVKNLLSVFLFFILSVTGICQTLTLFPNPATATVNANDADIPAKATLKNTSEESKEFKWVRNIVNITQGWETAVCDFNLCYNPSVDSMTLTLGPGEESNMDIHIYPNGVVGEAKIELTITEVGVDSNTIKGTYLFNVTTPVKKAYLGEIALYPNPTSEYFQVNTREVVAKLEVYNLFGDKYKTFYAYKNKRYFIGDLSNGMYLVRMLDINDSVIKTLRLNKR